MSFLTKDKRVLLLVDVSNIMYKALHVHKHLTNNGVFTGGIYGFMSQVSTAIRENEVSHVIFCFDRKPYFRDMYLDDIEYKAGREYSAETKAKVETTETAVEILTSYFTKWAFSGLEADDCIAYGIKRYYHRFDKIIVQTSDTDPYQCFRKDDKKLTFWKNQKDGLFTYEDFVEKSGVTTGREWLAIDAITGGHNGLNKGIVGYGDKKALALVQNRTVSDVGDFLYPYGEASFNFGVMQLPHPEIKQHAGKLKLNGGRITRKELVHFCTKYSIKLPPAWIESFTKVK